MEIQLDRRLSILTGINGCGKTTILEAIALWAECYRKLLDIAKRTVKGKYQEGDFILGPKNSKFLYRDEIQFVRLPNFCGIFRDGNPKQAITLEAVLVSEEQGIEIPIGFTIRNSKIRYAISLHNDRTFDYGAFNTIMKNCNRRISVFFPSPVSDISQDENFAISTVLDGGMRQRQSIQFIRNRIYQLYTSGRLTYFQDDLSYVLYGNGTNHIRLTCDGDINKDTLITVTYRSEHNPIEKDLSFAGSGTLQAMDILLDIYFQVDAKDTHLILIDEPDTHIRRDIQERLLEILDRASFGPQVIMTYRYEPPIRTASPANIIHVDGAGTATTVRSSTGKP